MGVRPPGRPSGRRAQQVIGHFGQQIPTFLGVEPADLGEQRHVGPFGQPARRWSCALHAGLADGHGRRRRTARPSIGSRRRVPEPRVDAVDDPAEVVATRPEQAVEAAAELGRLDLPGVGRADGAEHVGEDQAGLQEVEPAVELELPPVEQVPVEPGQGHVPVPEHPLVGQVVDRQQGPDRAAAVRAAVELVEVDGDQPGLPVVAVDDVGAEAQQADRLQHRPVEEDEPLAVVGVVARRGPGRAGRGRSSRAGRSGRPGRPSRGASSHGRPPRRPAPPIGMRRRQAGGLQRQARRPGPGDSRAGTSADRCPRRSRAGGRAPATSARPPVLANGTASDATKTTFIPGPRCDGPDSQSSSGAGPGRGSGRSDPCPERTPTRRATSGPDLDRGLLHLLCR